MFSKWNANEGGRQKGILPRCIFCLYIEDILKKVCEIQVSCRFGLLELLTMQNSDNVVVLPPSASDLQNILITIHDFLEEFYLAINTD